MPLRRITPALVIGAIGLAACQSAIPPPVSPSQPVRASVGGSPEESPVPYAHADAVIDMAPGPRGVAWADGSIWVASTAGDVVQRVEPATNTVVAEVDVGSRPVTLVTVGDELWVSVLNGDLSSDDEMVRIDMERNAAGGRVEVPIHHNVAVGAGRIWVQDLTGQLREVDPAAGAVTDAVASGIGPVALAANDAAVYGIRGGGTMWRWPTSGGELLEAALGVSVPGRSRVAATDDGVWVAVPGSVLALDPESLQITAQLSLPGLTLANDLYVDGSDAWLSANVTSEDLALDGGSVLRLDPDTLEVRETWRLGPESSGVVVAEGSVWAVDQSDDVLARFPATP